MSHGATGKGNDQVRFELTYAALAPDLAVIAPWREWDLDSRTALIEFARRHDIPGARDDGAAVLDRPQSVPHLLRGRHPRGPVDGAAAQDVPADELAGVGARRARVRRDRVRGGQPGGGGRPAPRRPWRCSSALNRLGGEHGIGRVDLVENRYVGMKSRGVYETPGGTILHAAHRALESLTLDREVLHLRDSLVPALRRDDLLRLLVLARARGAAGARSTRCSAT